MPIIYLKHFILKEVDIYFLSNKFYLIYWKLFNRFNFSFNKEYWSVKLYSDC